MLKSVSEILNFQNKWNFYEISMTLNLNKNSRKNMRQDQDSDAKNVLKTVIIKEPKLKVPELHLKQSNFINGFLSGQINYFIKHPTHKPF